MLLQQLIAMAEEGQDKGKGKALATDTVGDETTKQEEEAKEEKELTEANTPKPLELIPRPRNNPYGTRGEKLTLVANFFDVKYSAPKSHILLYDVSDICREGCYIFSSLYTLLRRKQCLLLRHRMLHNFARIGKF